MEGFESAGFRMGYILAHCAFLKKISELLFAENSGYASITAFNLQHLLGLKLGRECSHQAVSQ